MEVVANEMPATQVEREAEEAQEATEATAEPEAIDAQEAPAEIDVAQMELETEATMEDTPAAEDGTAEQAPGRKGRGKRGKAS